MNDQEMGGTLTLVLCPGCCTIADIEAYEYDPQEPPPLAGCARCSFTFPVLPAEAAELTLEAMRRHECRGFDEPENWLEVGAEIIGRVRELRLTQRELAERFARAFKPDLESDIPELNDPRSNSRGESP